MIDASMIPLIDQASDMFQLAISCNNMPVKAWEIELGIAKNSLYKIIDGARKLPAKAIAKLADESLVGACAVMMQETGFKRLLSHMQVDRHPQALIALHGKISNDTALATKDLSLLILNRIDLNNQQRSELVSIMRQLSIDANMSINLLIELEKRYRVKPKEYLR